MGLPNCDILSPGCCVSSAFLSLQPVWEQLQDKIRACPSNATWVALLQQQQQQNQQLQQAVQVLWEQYQLLWQLRDPAAFKGVLT